MNRAQRFFRHAFTTLGAVRRSFPKSALAQIEQAIKDCEKKHAGEIRFAVEAALHERAIWAGMTPRQRAIELFSQLRVWDTEHNNGVLIFVLLADRAVEIVADRGVARGRVPRDEWEKVCRLTEAHFREGRYTQGAVAGVQAVAEVLARYPAGARGDGNELSDAPVVIP